MAERSRSYFFHAASVLALALLIAGCTKGGQFDPTELFSSDVFDSKKKLKGERTPVFPEGVPGASTGVPADLVKGYQAPPEQPDADAAVPGPTPPAAAEAEKPKPKPRPKLAAQKPPASPGTAAPATRITVGPAQKPATQQPDASQTAWPAPSPTNAPQSQTSQSVWPAPPQTTSAPSAQPSQSIWPNPPSAGSSR
jgi:outer membrane biosynthesis protein TonB